MMEHYLNKLKNIIDEKIDNLFNDNNEFDKMCKYVVSSNGKRLRPIILYLLANYYNKDYSLIENEALAIELIHSYSLVHDDMPCMDNDDYRRGKLTAHKKFNEANALLIGDALLTYAFNILSRSKKANNLSFKILSEYAGKNELIYGQYMDINYKKLNEKVLIDTYFKKTASLFLAAINLAYIALEFPKEDLEKYNQFFTNLGIAYQINDDIEEYELNLHLGDEKSIVSLIGINEAKEMKEKYLKLAVKNLEKDHIFIDFLNYIMKKRENNV